MSDENDKMIVRLQSENRKLRVALCLAATQSFIFLIVAIIASVNK